MKDLFVGLLLLLLSIAVIYGGYWLAKNVSYALFYEGMVEGTVKELVKNTCIK